MGTDDAPRRLTRRRVQPSWPTYASHLTGRYHKRLHPVVDLPDFRKALAFAGDDGRTSGNSPYAFSVSRNRTGSPVDGVVTSPCHITRLPRTKVPTGQPVTRTPS